jgi:hypothetical protein
VSASEDRISRRLLRKMLKGAHCAACSGALDEHAHRALWIDDGGHPHLHLVCAACFEGGTRDEAATDELANRCALALCEPAGHA